MVAKLPSQDRVEIELLLLLSHRHEPLEARFAYELLAHDFELTTSQLTLRRSSKTNELEWPNLVRFAFRRLKDLGEVHTQGGRGMWSASDRGKTRAAIIERTRISTPEELGL